MGELGQPHVPVDWRSSLLIFPDPGWEHWIHDLGLPETPEEVRRCEQTGIHAAELNDLVELASLLALAAFSSPVPRMSLELPERETSTGLEPRQRRGVSSSGRASLRVKNEDRAFGYSGRLPWHDVPLCHLQGSVVDDVNEILRS